MQPSRPSLVAALSLLAPAAAAQRVLFESHPTSDLGYYNYGYAVVRAGDLDGDGREDFWMGGPDAYGGFGAGRVYLSSGRDGATSLTILLGEHGDQLGWSLAGGHDLSGDGVPDVVAGAPGSSDDAGAVHARSGVDGSALWSAPGALAGDRFGAALAWLGDIDGDGVRDVAVGAPHAFLGGARRGSVTALSGASGAVLGTLAGPSAQSEFGYALADAGDVDGDGCADLLVGAPRAELGVRDSGLALLYSGCGALLRVLAGGITNERFGHAVAGAGELDGDGVPDLLVGVPGDSEARAFAGVDGALLWEVARIRFGTSGGGFLADPPYFGWAVACIGDQDGDGRDDVAVGNPEASSVWFFSGADGSLLGLAASTYLQPVSTSSLTGYFGWSFARLGDLTGDGRDEIVVGAPNDDFAPGYPLTNPLGSADVLSLDVRFAPLTDGEVSYVAESVSGAGDVNGDGFEDVAFDGLRELVIVSGRDRSVLRRTPMEISGRPQAIAAAGDVDGDGVGDLVVAAVPSVQVLSGATGASLPGFAGYVATNVAGIGDVNGDGRADLALADAPPNPGGGLCWYPTPGIVRVVSGADGALLFERAGNTYADDTCIILGEVFGYSVSGVGDWNRDGTPDLAVGAPGGAAPLYGGLVRILSGIDGAILREFVGSGAYVEFGVSVSGGPDFDYDGDGWVDVLIGEQIVGYGPHASYGSALVFSSRDGAVVGGGSLSEPTLGYGRTVGPAYSVAALRDFDGDGCSDVAVGNPVRVSELGPGAGEIRISGRNGLLRVVSGSSSWDYLGYSVAAVEGPNGTTAVVAGAPALELPAGVAHALVITRASEAPMRLR